MKGDIYNVANGVEITIENAVKKMIAYLGMQTNLSFNNIARKGDPLNWRADISKLTELGFKSTVSVEEGLEKVCSWLKTIHP